MNKRLILMLLGVILLFGGIFGFKWFGNRMMNEFFDNMPVEAPTIAASSARLESWQPTLRAVGSFRAINGAVLSVELDGVVETIEFANGQPVARGQVLVRLDTAVDEADLDSLRAALRLAEIELERQQRLLRQRSTSEAERDRAEADRDQAAARVRAQQARVEQKIVRAPFDGIAGIRQVNLGQFVTPGDPVVAVQALDPIWFDFEVPESELARLTEDMQVTVRVDAWPQQRFAGRISAIEPGVRESTRTVTVQGTFDNPDGRLRPGMFGGAEVTVGSPEQRVVVPQTAIRYSPYGNSVFVIEEANIEGSDARHRVRQRFVRTGETRGDLIAIDEGLEPGQRVASAGLLKLENNLPVLISDHESTRPSEDPEPRPENR